MTTALPSSIGLSSLSVLRRGAFALLATTLLTAVPTSSRAQELPAPPNGQGVGPTAQESASSTSSPATLFFGAAVAIHGRHLLVGMTNYGADIDIGAGVGRVAVFTLNGANAWIRSATLDPPAAALTNGFGGRLALGDRYAMVGSANGVDVFRRKGEAWSHVIRLTSGNGQNYDGGLAVGDQSLLVGVSLDDRPGVVDVLQEDHRGRFHRVERLRAVGAAVGDGFGQDMATSHGTLVVGAAGYADGAGAAFVYQQFGAFWVPYARLRAASPGPGWQFGSAVAVSNDRILVGSLGAHSHDTNGQCQFAPGGSGYVFLRRGFRWVQSQEVMSSDPCVTQFATNVAISHDYVAADPPGLFRDQFSLVEIFKRTGALYERTYQAGGGEGSTATIALSGRWLIVGFPFRAQFDTGSVVAYDLDAAP